MYSRKRLASSKVTVLGAEESEPTDCQWGVETRTTMDVRFRSDSYYRACSDVSLYTLFSMLRD
jgi:hypothetical protein